MDDSISCRKLFIGGLSPHTTRETLQSHFEKFGAVQDSILMIDRVSGRSRCFGFVTMADPEVLNTILAQEQTIDSKRVDCKKAVPREQSANLAPQTQVYKTKKMFIGGLPADLTEESFKEFFQQFGEVEDSVVMLDRDSGRPRGFGFITFKSEESADKVLQNYEKNFINGKWVECKKATPRQGGSQPGYNLPYVMPSYYQVPYYAYGQQEYFNNYNKPGYNQIYSTQEYVPEGSGVSEHELT